MVTNSIVDVVSPSSAVKLADPASRLQHRLEMEDWDDDTPPPLSSIPDQVHAVSLSSSIIGTTGLKDGELRVAATTAPHTTAAATRQSKPFKRGFLDAIPQKASKQVGDSSEQKIAALKPKRVQQRGQNQVPSIFKLEPSPEEQRLNGMKKQLVTALQPTPETVEAISKDDTLASGFDDPEVLAAIAELARDPDAFKKYANNKKVQQFYTAFGNLMGSKLATIGQLASSINSSSSSSTVASTANNFLP